MAKERNFLKFKQDFGISDLKRTVGEHEPHLQFYYVGKEQYVERAIDRQDSSSVFIGPKGVGKSAVLQMVRCHAAETGNENRVIDISPDDLAFNALLNVEARTPFLASPNEHLWLFTSLWDYVLSIEVLCRELGNRSSIEGWFASVFGNDYKSEQKELLAISLDDNGKPRATSMTEKMLELVSAIELEVSRGDVAASARVEVEHTEKPDGTLRTLQLIARVAKSLPKKIEHEYYILIDDLDMHWTGSKVQNAFISSMFYSIRKLSRENKIKFVVSLRKRIFREISLVEQDKFEDFVCVVSWTKALAKEMVEERVSFSMSVKHSDIWGGLFPSNSFDFLYRNTDGMPREVTRLAVKCIENAIQSRGNCVTPEDVNEATIEFSKARIGDLASLFNNEYPGLLLVLRQFRGRQKQFSLTTLQEIGFAVCELVNSSSDDKLPILTWAEAGFEEPLSLARSLLRTGFIQLKDGRDSRPVTPDAEDIHLITKRNWFAIHPMYHAGLQLDGYDRFN